jgi:maltose phosphorylase
MNNYLKHNEWKIVEEGFHPRNNLISESLFSLGNGRMGHRGNFEEQYSGETLQGNYVAGVYYPDKTKVGWWKNGYPEYFAKVLNAANWIGIHIRIDGQNLDLATCKPENFLRELNMKEGYLLRMFDAGLKNGTRVSVASKRFLSMPEPEIGAIRYSVKMLNKAGKLKITPFVDADVINKDSNYEEKFWEEVYKEVLPGEGHIIASTKKTNFHVGTGMKFRVFVNGKPVSPVLETSEKEKYIANSFELELQQHDEVLIEKYGAVVSSEYYAKNKLSTQVTEALNRAIDKGFDLLFKEHAESWTKKWETSDIVIEGDAAAQQGIRFNVFQLNQTYTGDDNRLNIGPKGFTGEKYGGSTYWDTEAYCLPFYMGTADQQVARNLLLYRHKQLHKAIENAEKLGFNHGAALYPMVTMNGEECHNEWEITFEEIHRNGAIAYAIHNYINYTSDKEYLAPYGFEVLLAISRFWSQRVNFSAEKQKYVMLGVTGPNEYENNVNNNFHTSNMAVWTLKYTLETIDYLRKKHQYLFIELVEKWKFNEVEETARWKDIIEKMYFPWSEKHQIYLQQDGFLDKEIIPADKLHPAERPINQKWSWDRILRSCYIKQADVLQSMFWFEDDYNDVSLRRHFDFYEPITVHESSLSPCVHAILAAKLKKYDKTYEMYLRTARLDLDNYNHDTDDGCHITSMGGTWMAFVMGFGGLRVKNNKLSFDPFIPAKWKSFSFRINFRGTHLKIQVDKKKFEFINLTSKNISLVVCGQTYELKGNSSITVKENVLAG